MVYAAQGDAQRTMTLLWHPGEPERPTLPGPKPGLTVDAVVRAAIDLADARGLDAVSMRAVGDRLGRTGMALYTYVPSKSELVDLMHDRVLAELPTDYPLDGGWRPALTAWAEATRACYLRHPWLLSLSQARPVLGPNEFASLDTLVRVLRETALPATTLRAVVGALFSLVRGAAQTFAEARQAPTATGVTDTAWWTGRTGALERVAPEFTERYPMVSWLGQDRSASPHEEQEARRLFDATLSVLLDGIEAAARAHQRQRQKRR